MKKGTNLVSTFSFVCGKQYLLLHLAAVGIQPYTRTSLQSSMVHVFGAYYCAFFAVPGCSAHTPGDSFDIDSDTCV